MRVRTIAIQIGNSDDKLTQRDWSEFVEQVGWAIGIVERGGGRLHFFGTSRGDAPWQNAAWIFRCPDANIDLLKDQLKVIRARFLQDSLAWLEAETQFI